VIESYASFPDLWATDSLFALAAPYFGFAFAIATARFAYAIGAPVRR
jgi:hypothetical protein